MLDHLGLTNEATQVMEAIAATTAVGVLTPDLGGTATTREVGKAILARLGD
jgi:tartrate dehydrogenase/decarboxylase/D-malate dehydrogenase